MGQKGGEHAKWYCKCLLCGSEDNLISTSNLHRQESCGCLQHSKGERKIKELLELHNIAFVQEKRYFDCVFADTNRQARFDFYLPDYNCLIEYDGRQHYIQGNGVYDNEEKFNRTKQHDEFKNQYAAQKGIALIRIPYTQLEELSIDDLLPATSSFIRTV